MCEVGEQVPRLEATRQARVVDQGEVQQRLDVRVTRRDLCELNVAVRLLLLGDRDHVLGRIGVGGLVPGHDRLLARFVEVDRSAVPAGADLEAWPPGCSAGSGSRCR